MNRGGDPGPHEPNVGHPPDRISRVVWTSDGQLLNPDEREPADDAPTGSDGNSESRLSNAPIAPTPDVASDALARHDAALQALQQRRYGVPDARDIFLDPRVLRIAAAAAASLVLRLLAGLGLLPYPVARALLIPVAAGWLIAEYRMSRSRETPMSEARPSTTRKNKK